MKREKTETERLVDIKAALKAAKPKDETTLEELATVWGVTKPRFVTKKLEFVGFPDKIRVEKNVHIFKLIPCLKAMIAHIERHLSVSKSKTKRLAELTGIDHMQAEQHGNLSIAEIAKANQIGTELEQRALDQGLYVPILDVQRDVGQVFSLMSEFYSTAANRLDPHGRLLTPEMRAALEKNAHDSLLEMHSILKAWLSGDVDGTPTGSAARRDRKAPTRRKPPKRAPRKAR